MKKKIYIAIFMLIATLTISYSYCFANNTMSTAVDGIRNAVGGAENVVEDAGKGVVEGIRNITDAGENTMENMTSGMNNKTAMDNNTGYTSTRTATRTTATNTGISSTMWTWIIMAIVGIIIIALVWMYAKQNNTYKNNNY